jgi:hypothetical protein
MSLIEAGDVRRPIDGARRCNQQADLHILATLARRLDIPGHVMKVIDLHLDRGPLVEFLAIRTRSRAGGKVSAGELFEAYLAWSAQKDVEPIEQTAFGRAVTALGIYREKSGKMWYRGIEMIADATS